MIFINCGVYGVLFRKRFTMKEEKSNFQNRLVFYYEDTCLEKGKCSVSSLQPTDTHIIQRDVFIDEEFSHTEKYKHVQLMKLVNASSELCHNECFNKRVNSPYTFSIAGTHLKFNEANDMFCFNILHLKRMKIITSHS